MVPQAQVRQAELRLIHIPGPAALEARKMQAAYALVFIH
jgi:hypothetical protein